MNKTRSIYDRVWCFQKIEETWDCSCYEYIQQLQRPVKPSIALLDRSAGFEIKINY